MEVKNHIILLLDILGYKNLVKECKSIDEQNELLEEIHGLMSKLSWFINESNRIHDTYPDRGCNMTDFKYFIFSDNIVFFAPYESETEMLNLTMNLCVGLSEFLFRYQKRNLFFRGAITKGLLYFDEKLPLLFGTGLVDVYTMESEKAKTPRILVDNCLASPILSEFKKDEDGLYFLDYLESGFALFRRSQKQKDAFAIIHNQKNAIENMLRLHSDNSHIFEKYLWLARYHNQFCIKHTIEDILEGLEEQING